MKPTIVVGTGDAQARLTKIYESAKTDPKTDGGDLVV